MSDAIITVENLSKRYRLGQIGATTLRDSVERWMRRLRGHGVVERGMLKVEREGSSDSSRSTSYFQRSTTASKEEELWALKDVSFEVQRGEVLGIIGRNGAGKSTLLKVLSRITEPTSGRAIIRGRVASLLEVGTGFHPELTGRENIFLNGAILGMRKAEIAAKFDEIVAFAEIEKFIDTPVKRYSSGMYVRLAFAVAAHLEPEILLVDEVLAVGDAAFQKKCLGKMEDVAKAGRTVLFVSHNMAAVQTLCNRIIWIEHGSIAARGESGPVIHEYLEHLQEGEGRSNTLLSLDGSLEILAVRTKNDAGESSSVFPAGSALRIEVEYEAKKSVKLPYLWVGVASQWGPLFGASMLLDGTRPRALEGRGTLACRFERLPLMPQQIYIVRFGGRAEDGKTQLFNTTDMGYFHVSGSAAAAGLRGEYADVMIGTSAPILVPYEWTMPDGTKIAIDQFKRQQEVVA